MKEFELLNNVIPVSMLHNSSKTILKELTEKKRVVVMKHQSAIAVLLSPEEYLRLKHADDQFNALSNEQKTEADDEQN